MESLLGGMQGLLNAYNFSGSAAVTPPPLPPPAVGSGGLASQAEVAVVRPHGNNFALLSFRFGLYFS